jgi:hypothetical protein
MRECSYTKVLDVQQIITAERRDQISNGVTGRNAALHMAKW